MVIIHGTSPSPALPAELSRAADKLETVFLAEMLKISMPAAGSGAFGGGIGESQFSSFLTEWHAAAMAARLDLNLMQRLSNHA